MIRGLLANLRQGPIPAELGITAVTDWDEFEADPWDEDTEPDGDNSVHAHRHPDLPAKHPEDE